MALKEMLLILAAFLLITATSVDPFEERDLHLMGALIPGKPLPATPPARSPTTSPAPSPPVKPSTPHVPSPPPLVKAPAAPPPSVYPPPKPIISCPSACQVRCKLHSRKNLCLRACMTCCYRCKCVPPGQYGNLDKCGPCYANMTTRYGKRKCP